MNRTEKKNQIEHLAVAHFRFFRLLPYYHHGTVVSRFALDRVLLVRRHAADINSTEGSEQNEKEAQDGVDVVGNGSEEDVERFLDAAVPDLRNDHRRPAGNGDQNAHAPGHGVDHVGRLRLGYLVSVQHHAHHCADCDDAEVVVQEKRAGDKKREEYR